MVSAHNFRKETFTNARNQFITFLMSVDPMNRWVDVISFRCQPFDHQVEITIISEDEL